MIACWSVFLYNVTSMWSGLKGRFEGIFSGLSPNPGSLLYVSTLCNPTHAICWQKASYAHRCQKPLTFSTPQSAFTYPVSTAATLTRGVAYSQLSLTLINKSLLWHLNGDRAVSWWGNPLSPSHVAHSVVYHWSGIFPIVLHYITTQIFLFWK